MMKQIADATKEPPLTPAALRAWRQGYMAYLESKGVPPEDIHDLHIWGLSTRETALTAHLVMPTGHPGDQALQALSHGLQERFAIDHSTIQVDLGDGCHPCALVPRAA